MEIPMIAYLVVSTIMFFAGVYGFVTRKNMLAMLISLEFDAECGGYQFCGV